MINEKSNNPARVYIGQPVDINIYHTPIFNMWKIKKGIVELITNEGIYVRDSDTNEPLYFILLGFNDTYNKVEFCNTSNLVIKKIFI